MSNCSLSDFELGQIIRKKRKSLKLTLKDVCNEIKEKRLNNNKILISIQTLSMYERGKLNPKPSEKYREQLYQWLLNLEYKITGNNDGLIEKNATFVKAIEKNNFIESFIILRKNLKLSQAKVCALLPVNENKKKINQNTLSLYEREKLSEEKMAEVQEVLLIFYDKYYELCSDLTKDIILNPNRDFNDNYEIFSPRLLNEYPCPVTPKTVTQILLTIQEID